MPGGMVNGRDDSPRSHEGHEEEMKPQMNADAFLARRRRASIPSAFIRVHLRLPFFFFVPFVASW
jgi:hypothetical protein